VVFFGPGQCCPYPRSEVDRGLRTTLQSIEQRAETGAERLQMVSHDLKKTGDECPVLDILSVDSAYSATL